VINWKGFGRKRSWRNFKVLFRHSRSRVSSDSIVSDYGLDDRAIEVRSPAGAKDFYCSLCVQICSGAHPASFTMGTGGPFAGVKRGRGVTLTTHPHLVPRSRISRSYTSSPPPQATPWRVAGLLYPTFTGPRTLKVLLINAKFRTAIMFIIFNFYSYQIKASL
jgi:hypothetical protein